VEQTLTLSARPEFQETEASRARADGLALCSRVRAALAANETTRETNVSMDCAGGKIVLTGLVLDEKEREEVTRVASTVVGTGNVDNQLRVMAISRKFTYSKT
jgi:osmotically-inducible protein OsmY